jgi:hypothetical protein
MMNTTVQFQSTTNASAVPHVLAGEAWTTQPGGCTLFGLRRSPRLFDISGPLQNTTAASSTFVFAYIWLMVKTLGWSSTKWLISLIAVVLCPAIAPLQALLTLR